MKDLTQGPIYKHLISMSVPILFGMFVQTLYFLIDLYFVGQLGDAALAGVSSAGVLFFFVMALTQVLNVGVGTLVSHAVGKKDKQEARLLLSQGLLISAICISVLLIMALAGGRWYFTSIAPDKDTLVASLTYFYWFLPALFIQFPLTVLLAALRGAGVVKQPMLINMFALALNAILSPILITGWGFGIEMGVAGAALASSISTGIGLVLIWVYFNMRESYLTVSLSCCIPCLKTIKKIINLGLPAGGEFLLTFIYMSLIYWVLSDFDASAQAGFGLGARIMQALFLPVLAVAFAAPAIAGQNFAAGNTKRVYQTYYQSALLTCGLMLLINIVCVLNVEAFLAPFSKDSNVIDVASIFLGYVCFNFVPAGYVLAASGMFQAMGNAWPALISSAVRLSLFAASVIFVASQADFSIEQIWVISMATVYIQAIISFYLLRRELNKKLNQSTSEELAQVQTS
ncbi:MATE family efflux transporter [Pseudoalteromonas luteoviolacea]|uniref:MATE family efflux transporter n=1 Tax=Pseudoalteromonas luteoviolacea TaxID=43657 RepID=UPI001B387249|nr:MATE family efflux transporter [Pseudoalteromonas luteoviolacea]MBQ4812253.1 MATE family efflux transporter [Pseudoalteromonas luteoviolacea]